jgi:hypothetical protein
MAAEVGAVADSFAFDQRRTLDGIHRPAVRALHPDLFEPAAHVLWIPGASLLKNRRVTDQLRPLAAFD